ncbi:MAG: ATP-binding cassette domain-containing protein [Planctomycetota bacterium]|nr:ATP-binding cassette domain-containing protein [Planctomycetota bacterium]
MNLTPPLLQLENISFRFGHDRSTKPALNQVSIKIPLGVHTAILGPNGSGKSTLLKLLLRLLYPDPWPETPDTLGSELLDSKGHSDLSKPERSPEIAIMGRSDWNVWELRKQLGYVSGEIDQHFTQGRSGRLTGLDAAVTGFTAGELAIEIEQMTDEMRSAAEESLKMCGVGHLATRAVAGLSTGERRRVMLARAMVHRPIGLVLDEPTAGLDIASRAIFLNQIELLARSGTTLILVTHHIEEVIPIINRVLLLKNGNVYFDGNRDEAIQSERLSSLFNVPLSVHRNKQDYLFMTLD